MTKKDFEKRIKSIFSQVLAEMNGAEMESVSMWCGTRIGNVFQYGAVSERSMERQLMDLKGCERKTTFMSDLSIGEWCSSWRGVFDTIHRSMVSWKDNVEMMSEFVLCVNWKAWEHSARGNANWTKLYSLLYEGVRDLMYDYYEGDSQKTSYMWSYLD